MFDRTEVPLTFGKFRIDIIIGILISSRALRATNSPANRGVWGAPIRLADADLKGCIFGQLRSFKEILFALTLSRLLSVPMVPNFINRFGELRSDWLA